MSATAGTTVYGAFDPLIAISDICRKYGVWMHVDVSANEPVSTFLYVTVSIGGTLRSPVRLTSLLGASRH